MKFLKKPFAVFISLFFVNMLPCNNSYAHLDDFDQKTSICKKTGTKYDMFGYDIYGYDKFGFTRRGFDKNGIHKLTGTKFSPKGQEAEGYEFDVDGYSKEGAFWGQFGFYTFNGFAAYTFGFNSKGFDRYGNHKDTGTKYDLDGYNVEGFDKKGIHKLTKTELSPGGFDVFGWNPKMECYVSNEHRYRNRNKHHK